MSKGVTIDRVHIDRVLTTLQQEGMHCPLEKVPGLCPDLTADQVFLAIDYLTRSGRVCLTRDRSSIHCLPDGHTRSKDFQWMSRLLLWKMMM